MPNRLYRLPVAALTVLCASWPTLATAGTTPVPEPIDAQVVAVVTDPRIDNASGLATSPDGRIMYTHQDQGRSTDVFGLDSQGKVQFAIHLPTGTNTDWEDMAAVSLAGGRRAIFLADTGDALSQRRAAGQSGRRDYRIIRVNEPPSSTTGVVKATGVATYRLRYADGAVGRNAETLLVQPRTGHVFVVTKAEDGRQPTSVWTAPADLRTQGVNTLTRVVPDLSFSRASGGAFSPSGDRIVIRNDDTAFVWWVDDGDVAGALATKPQRVPLPHQPQGEGVTFTPDGHSLLINSEGVGQPIWQVPLPRAVDTERIATTPQADHIAMKDDTTVIAIALVGGGLLVAIFLVGFHLRRHS